MSTQKLSETSLAVISQNLSGYGELPCLMLRHKFWVLSNIYGEAFCENNKSILTINYFCKMLHHRSMAGSTTFTLHKS